ncbi:hypothetical protein QOT17_020775 [Balamuthia mandrillaris]
MTPTFQTRTNVLSFLLLLTLLERLLKASVTCSSITSKCLMAPAVPFQKVLFTLTPAMPNLFSANSTPSLRFITTQSLGNSLNGSDMVSLHSPHSTANGILPSFQSPKKMNMANGQKSGSVLTLVASTLSLLMMST